MNTTTTFTRTSSQNLTPSRPCTRPPPDSQQDIRGQPRGLPRNHTPLERGAAPCHQKQDQNLCGIYGSTTFNFAMGRDRSSPEIIDQNTKTQRSVYRSTAQADHPPQATDVSLNGSSLLSSAFASKHSSQIWLVLGAELRKAGCCESAPGVVPTAAGPAEPTISRCPSH